MKIHSLLALACLLGCAGNARAQAQARVVATDPAGTTLTLAPHQPFYLRIAYRTDRPVHIWARPYLHGVQVPAASHPSSLHEGSGETLGWFRLDAGQAVDEVRILAGTGAARGTPTVASYPVRIEISDAPAAAREAPAWVSTLRRRDEAIRLRAMQAQANEPASTGGTVFVALLMPVVLVLLLAGIAAPAWALWRWRGGWRLAAAVPATLMALAVARIVFDTARDPTSHNLWPFEILLWGACNLLAIIVLALARLITGNRRDRDVPVA